jgi:hypothetical protein
MWIWSIILRFFNINLPFYHVHPNSILFTIIKFYSTESIFKIIWIACIELWEVHVYINSIWARFGIGCHPLAFSINKRKSNWFVCRMNKDVINLCYYFSCKIFALDHWQVEISTHWPNLASAINHRLCNETILKALGNT